MRWRVAVLITCALAAAARKSTASPSAVVHETVTLSTTDGDNDIARQRHQENQPLIQPNPIADHHEREHDLTTWAATTALSASAAHTTTSHCVDCFLVVGVKTSTLHGFAARQAIRETWADPQITQKLHTRVVFLGCAPDFDETLNATEDQVVALRNALALEKRTYGDLLIEELPNCHDSYDRLVDKTLSFFRFVATTHPTAAFVMLADDDVYVRLDKLTAMLHDPNTTPRTRFYAGQVWATQYRQPIAPVRDPTHKNFVSTTQYPLTKLPPFAHGPHYVLSMDLVRFLSRNSDYFLRGVGPLEDVSVGFWLLTLLRVRAVHLPQFTTLLNHACHNRLVSYSDISTTAQREIHANLHDSQNASFCRGFSFRAWSKTSVSWPSRPSPVVPNHSLPVKCHWSLQLDPVTRTLHIDVQFQPLTTPAVPFTPSSERFVEFCAKTIQQVAPPQPHLLIRPSLCETLRAHLRAFLVDSPPINPSLLALAVSNLQPFVVENAAIVVWISRRGLRWRAMIESLVAQIYVDVQVFVVEETSVPLDSIVPDIVVITSGDLSEIEVNVVDIATRVVVLSLEENDDAVSTNNNNITIHHRVFYVPLVSAVLSDSQLHRPLTLLQASTAMTDQPSLVIGAVCSSSTSDLNPSATAALQSLLELELEPVGCYDEQHLVFALDALVARFKSGGFAFVAASKDQAIVASFLAGAIPIYYGNSTSVSHLFNKRAFIDCGGGAFASMEACATRILHVYHSPTLYESMRREPPIVNTTAFIEAFSWHPDVVQVLSPHKELHMSERLQELLNSM